MLSAVQSARHPRTGSVSAGPWPGQPRPLPQSVAATGDRPLFPLLSLCRHVLSFCFLAVRVWGSSRGASVIEIRRLSNEWRRGERRRWRHWRRFVLGERAENRFSATRVPGLETS